MRSTFFLALAGLATLTLSKSHIKHHMKVKAAWPAVVAPMNYEYKFKAYHLDPVTNELTRDFELGALHFSDSEHNQKLISSLRTIGGVEREIFTFIDFGNNYFTDSIPDMNLCIKRDLPAGLNIDLKQIMLDMLNPEMGLTQYAGVTTLPYANSTYH